MFGVFKLEKYDKLALPATTMTHLQNPPLSHSMQRLDRIAFARQALLQQQATCLPANALAPWIERSWQRCLQWGLQSHQAVSFNQVSEQHQRHTSESNHHLANAARPTLQALGRAIINTRYFAILTNAQGVVIDASGAIDHSDPRAHLITRIGTDLSERSIGTTAIGTALAELQPVWLHRGEHFFETTSVYSCAGAPLFGPDGNCIGMLDVTGIDALERPELKHLVRQSACKIENALLMAQPHTLLLRLNWPGNTLGSDADGIVCLDADGWVQGANRVARQLVSGLGGGGSNRAHVSEIFGLPFEHLFDAAKKTGQILELPLWSGLRLAALVLDSVHEVHHQHAATAPALRDVQAAMIRKAVNDAHGNVGQAARVLGISRATLYRKLVQKTTT